MIRDSTPADEVGLLEIAEHCGIENPRTVPDAIPAEQFRENGGIVRCELSNREPFPPEVIVANYPLPDGGRQVLCDEVYADKLADAHGLDDDEATALAYARAGWSAVELHAVMRASEPGDVLQSAREKVAADSG